MDNYSLSDLRAAVGDDNGAFGGNGAWWVILLFLFWGFNGNGWNRQGEFGQYATAASQQEILFGQQFGQLNDRLNTIGNGICDSTFALNNSILTEGRALQNQLADCCCKNQLATANLSAQMNQNACDITTAIHAEGGPVSVLRLQQLLQHLTHTPPRRGFNPAGAATAAPANLLAKGKKLKCQNLQFIPPTPPNPPSRPAALFLLA
jgi:hypothetical protein